MMLGARVGRSAERMGDFRPNERRDLGIGLFGKFVGGADRHGNHIIAEEKPLRRTADETEEEWQ